jgi:hypothetical protein
MILNYKNDIMAECLLSSTAIYTKVFCSLINTDEMLSFIYKRYGFWLTFSVSSF